MSSATPLAKDTDGGTTWSRSLFRDNQTGAVDLSMDATRSVSRGVSVDYFQDCSVISTRARAMARRRDSP